VLNVPLQLTLEIINMSDILWGAEAIGRAAGIVDDNGEVNIRKVFHQLENGHLPAQKKGRLWQSTKTAIHRALEINPPQQTVTD
jgi:hypothetical protein